MKRFLFIFSCVFVVLFSSCNINKEHWIAVQVFQDNELLESHYDRDTKTYYVNVKRSDPFELRYFILPESDDTIDIISIEYTNDIISLTSFNEPVITFMPLTSGIPHISIKSRKQGSCSPIEIRIIN